MRDLENTTLTSKEEAARQYEFIEKAIKSISSCFKIQATLYTIGCKSEHFHNNFLKGNNNLIIHLIFKLYITLNLQYAYLNPKTLTRKS